MAPNAGGLFSFDGQRLTFQSTRARMGAIRSTMKIDGTDIRPSAAKKGRRPAAFYRTGNILYASTHSAVPRPPNPDKSGGMSGGTTRPTSFGSIRRDHPCVSPARRYDAEGDDRQTAAWCSPACATATWTVLDERRRLGCPAPDQPAGPRRSALTVRRSFAGIIRPGARLDIYKALLKRRCGNRRSCRCSRSIATAATEEVTRGRRELGALLLARRHEDHLRVEHEGPRGPTSISI